MSAKIILFLIISGWIYTVSSQQEEFRIIYIIHGDGNYLYHDEEGNAINAAERILEQAKHVAENIKRGEVFIFFQKPSGSFLFFNNDDGEFYYYKNGLTISEESYSGRKALDFEVEAGLIKKYSENAAVRRKNILLYYGHEVPKEGTSGYHSSYPEKQFGINIFADGIGRIISSSLPGKFDLIVLSTCRNGNEDFITALTPLTDYLIASPGDIHLSYLNSESLISLANNESISSYDLAFEFTRYSYEKLSSAASTEVIINIYDLRNTSGDAEDRITKFYRQAEFGFRKNKVK